jgi:hypothetical protein
MILGKRCSKRGQIIFRQISTVCEKKWPKNLGHLAHFLNRPKKTNVQREFAKSGHPAQTTNLSKWSIGNRKRPTRMNAISIDWKQNVVKIL